MDDPDALLPVESAGNAAGISPRTLRYWIRGGKLPAVEGQRGKLVRLGDVLAIAEMTGKLPASRRQPAGSSTNLAGSAVGSAGNAAAEMVGDAGEASALAVETARAQLEAIRDEWLRPLIERSEELARQLGRAEAERDQAAQERDALRVEVERLRIAKDAPATQLEPRGAAEGSKPAPDTLALGWRRWWRRLVGGP